MKTNRLTPERLLSGISVIYFITGTIFFVLSFVALFMKESSQSVFTIFMIGLGLITIGLVLGFIVEFSHRLTRIENKLDHINSKI